MAGKARLTAASPTWVVVSEADHGWRAAGGQRGLQQALGSQSWQPAGGFLNLQMDGFHPGLIVVQLRPQIKWAAEDGRQLPELPLLETDQPGL